MQIFTFPRKAKWLLQYLGWFRGIIVVLAKPFAVVTKLVSRSEWYWQFVEKQFDQRHGIDTVEIVPVKNLSLTKREADQAVFYEPTPIMEFGFILSRLGINFSDYTFLDLGSGKGRALLLATWFDFKKIIGVEISKPLHEIAQQNILSFHESGKIPKNNVFSMCEDASNVSIPTEPLVIFLFNPFHEQIIEAFLESLRHSLRQNFKPTTILYGNPIHDHVFENCNWLTKKGCELRGWYSVYVANEDSISSAMNPK